MCFSSVRGTFALHGICCWWLVIWLSAWATRCIPAAEGGCSVKSLTSWQLCFLLMALIWSLCFTHCYSLGKQRVLMQSNANSNTFLGRTQKEQMGDGPAPLGKRATSCGCRSIWRGFPLESQIAQKQLYVPLYMPFIWQMLLRAITRSYCPLVCVCTCEDSVRHTGERYNLGILMTRDALGPQREKQVCFLYNTSTGSNQMRWVGYFCM